MRKAALRYIFTKACLSKVIWVQWKQEMFSFSKCLCTFTLGVSFLVKTQWVFSHQDFSQAHSLHYPKYRVTLSNHKLLFLMAKTLKICNVFIPLLVKSKTYRCLIRLFVFSAIYSQFSRYLNLGLSLMHSGFTIFRILPI